jgi:hypothetical protein
MKKLSKILLVLGLISLFLPIQSVLAQAVEGNKTTQRCGETFAKPLNFMFNVPLPGFPGGNSIQIDCLTLGDYLSYLYKFVIGLVGLLSVFMITLGGLMWIFAGGKSGKVKQAIGYIKGAVAGLLLAVFSYSLLYIVNPQLVEIKRIGLPVVKKAMLAICPTEPETDIYISKYNNADVKANMTACGFEFAKKEEPGGATCWGMACPGANGKPDPNQICTPYKEGKVEEAKNAGRLSEYGCVNLETLRYRLVKTCNDLTDTSNDPKAQNESQPACDQVNSANKDYVEGQCIWLDYSNFNMSDKEGCTWCSKQFSDNIEALFQANLIVCDEDSAIASEKITGKKPRYFTNPKDNVNQENGLCPDCKDKYSEGSDHEEQINACVKLIYKRLCNK